MSKKSDKRESERLERYRKNYIVNDVEVRIIAILSEEEVSLEDILTYLVESEFFYGAKWYVDEGGVVLTSDRVVEDYRHYLEEKKLAGA